MDDYDKHVEFETLASGKTSIISLIGIIRELESELGRGPQTALVTINQTTGQVLNNPATRRFLDKISAVKDHQRSATMVFVRYMEERPSFTICEEVVSNFLKWVNKDARRPDGRSYSNDYKRSIRCALKARLLEFVPENQDERIKLRAIIQEWDENKDTKAPPEPTREVTLDKIITPIQWEKLWADPWDGDDADHKNARVVKYLIKLCLQAACRISDCVGRTGYDSDGKWRQKGGILIRDCKIVGDDCIIKVVGKFEKENIYYCDAALFHKIREVWPGDTWLFTGPTNKGNRRGLPIGYGIVRRAIMMMGDKYGFHYTTHMNKRGTLSAGYELTKDLIAQQKRGRHVKAETTAKHYIFTDTKWRDSVDPRFL